jgi:hypothetical protein
MLAETGTRSWVKLNERACPRNLAEAASFFWAHWVRRAFPRTTRLHSTIVAGLAATMRALSGLSAHAINDLLASVRGQCDQAYAIVIGMLISCEKFHSYAEWRRKKRRRERQRRTRQRWRRTASTTSQRAAVRPGRQTASLANKSAGLQVQPTSALPHPGAVSRAATANGATQAGRGGAAVTRDRPAISGRALSGKAKGAAEMERIATGTAARRASHESPPHVRVIKGEPA